MNKSLSPLTVAECKIQASILLKTARSADSNTKIKHKHALAAIALAKGFVSWTDLKCQLPFIRGGFLNQWFADYAEAKAHLNTKGGFLLPYKKQFFICEASYIQHLGLDPQDADWLLIDYDWAKPADQKAWQRLYKKWMQLQEVKL
jgi:hypothetical protein